MSKDSIKQFFKPDWRKLVLLCMLVFIAYAGSIQSWVFSGKDSGFPKPLLYDLLDPIPFWVIWMYLLTPIFVITGGTLNFVPPWIFWIVNFIYFYVISCVAVFIFEKVKKKK